MATTTAKHTPGEWNLQPSAGHHDYLVYGLDDGKDIAIVRDFHEANARLIAAAPELLEALQECITDPGAQCIVTCDVAFMIRRFKAINEIARQAIAKATGE